MPPLGRAVETELPQQNEAPPQAPAHSSSLIADAYGFVERHPIASAATVGLLSVGAYAASRYIPYAMTQRALSVAARSLNPEDIRIVPLTEKNLPAAIEAGKDGFRYGMGFLNPAHDFKASLNPLATKIGETGLPHTEMNARYFLAIDKEGRVLGTTGLYETSKD